MIIIDGDHSYTATTISTAVQCHETGFADTVRCNTMKEPHSYAGATTSTAAQCHKTIDADRVSCNIVTVQKLGKNYNKKCTYLRFIKQMKRLSNIENKRERVFEERYNNAKELSQNSNFLRNINKLSKHSQTFLLMQLKMVGKKKKALRFTTDEKLLSLSLMKESPKGYRFLQKIFILPSKRTLNRLAEKIIFKPGIHENIFNLLERKASKWSIKQKLCSIVYDEVALTPQLTFLESQDEVKGFKDLGDERYLKFSDHALVFMVRGICASWRQPIAYYFCEGTISSQHLVKILKEIVCNLSHTGLIPLALICDQGSTFRTAINILKKDTECERTLNNIPNERLKSGEKISGTMQTTGEMVAFFDKLFDSVNGSRKSSTRGKLRGAIKPNSEHITFWQESKKVLKNIKYVDINSKRALKHVNKELYVRVPSLDGWIVTLESLERIAKLLFDKYGVEYLYPRNLNQDPLENFFGRIRALNYRNVNPDCYMFINSFKSLLISNVMGPHSIYSNCEKDDGETVFNFFNLLKCKPPNGEDKENIDPLCDIQSSHNGSNNEELFEAVINEKIKVHASAYTAGYICRKMSKKINCKNCKKTYTALEKENIHDWIAHREYKRLKNSNLAYCSKAFLVLYRNLSEFIHSYLNIYAHTKNVGKTLKNLISNKFDLSWIGCENHTIKLVSFFKNLIVRLHVHNWCNIINKILRGALDEKFVCKMKMPQKLALEKYKANKLKKRKINI